MVSLAKDSVKDSIVPFPAGTRVQIRESRRSPCASASGVLLSIDLNDERAPYLVRFDDGTEFRYNSHEIQLPSKSTRRSLVARILSALRLQASSPSQNQPQFNPSVPSRFGTRQQ